MLWKALVLFDDRMQYTVGATIGSNISQHLVRVPLGESCSECEWCLEDVFASSFVFHVI